MDELQFDSFVRYISMYYGNLEIYSYDLTVYRTVYSFIMDVYNIVRPYQEIYYANEVATVSEIPIRVDFTMSATVWYRDIEQSDIRYATNIKSNGDYIVLDLGQNSTTVKKLSATYKHIKGKYTNGSIYWEGQVVFTIYYNTSKTKQEVWKECTKLSFQNDLQINFYYYKEVADDENPENKPNQEWYYRIERTVCRLCGIETISEETSFVQDLHVSETKLEEMYDSLYVHYGVNIADDAKQKISTFGDLKQEYTECRNSLLSKSPSLQIDIGDFYDLILDELGYSAVEDIGPYSRFIEDLGCDSLEVFELCYAIEEEYNIEMSDEAVRMFMYNIKDIYTYLTGQDI